MGSYIYSLKKKSINATLLPENKKVVIAMMTYTCRDTYDIFDEYCSRYPDYARERRIITKADNLVLEKGFKPDYFVLCGENGFRDGIIYTWNGQRSISDDNHSGKYGGYLMKVGGRWNIIPCSERGEINVKNHFPKLYEDLYLDTQIYVRMSDRYVATVRNLASLDDYMFDFGKKDVDVNVLGIHSVCERVPAWFKEEVQQRINKRLLMEKGKIKKVGYADFFMAREPEYYDNLV